MNVYFRSASGRVYRGTLTKAGWQFIQTEFAGKPILFAHAFFTIGITCILAIAFIGGDGF